MKAKLGAMVSNICTKNMLSAFSSGKYHGDALENTMRHFLNYLYYTGHVLFNKSVTEEIAQGDDEDADPLYEPRYTVDEVLALYKQLPEPKPAEKLLRMMVWVCDKDCRGFISTYCSNDPMKFEMLGMNQKWSKSRTKYDVPMLGAHALFCPLYFCPFVLLYFCTLVLSSFCTFVLLHSCPSVLCFFVLLSSCTFVLLLPMPSRSQRLHEAWQAASSR